MIWHLYLVRTREGTLYTGIATDVGRRFEEHREGGAKASRYLRGRGPLRLVFQRKIGSRPLALRVERRIKHLPKRTKEEIVHRRPAARDLITQLGL